MIKYKLKSYEQKLFDLVDSILTWKHLLLVVFFVGVVFLILYFLNINMKGKIEHAPTYLFFGIITVFGFLLGYRILFYVRPVINMEQYVKYLTDVLKDTTRGDKLIVLASTPNPGFSDYLESNKDENHYYHKYEKVLKDCAKRCPSIEYRILPYGEVKEGVIIELDENSPMMQFLQPFLKNLKTKEEKQSYKKQLKRLLEDIQCIVKPTAAPIEDKNKGVLIISHPRMGFMGVHDVTGGVLKIRGVKVGESVFLRVLEDIVELLTKK